MSTRPMTVVSLRICRHPSARPTAQARRHWRQLVESSNPGGGKDREHSRRADQDLPRILRDHKPDEVIIDKTGKEVIPFKYDMAKSFSRGLAEVTVGANSGYIGPDGTEYFEP